MHPRKEVKRKNEQLIKYKVTYSGLCYIVGPPNTNTLDDFLDKVSNGEITFGPDELNEASVNFEECEPENIFEYPHI